jgi:hypothetical protein
MRPADAARKKTVKSFQKMTPALFREADVFETAE